MEVRVNDVSAPISLIVISLNPIVSYREAQAFIISSFLAFVNSSEPFGITFPLSGREDTIREICLPAPFILTLCHYL